MNDYDYYKLARFINEIMFECKTEDELDFISSQIMGLIEKHRMSIRKYLMYKNK